jgi:hypothetical protein
VEVAREDEGDGERCSGLARRSGSVSDSLSEGCSCRSFRDSLIVAWSKCRRTDVSPRLRNVGEAGVSDANAFGLAPPSDSQPLPVVWVRREKGGGDRIWLV